MAQRPRDAGAGVTIGQGSFLAERTQFDLMKSMTLGEIGNLYGRKQLSPPFSLKEYATRWMADGIPRAHCVEQVRKHLDTCGHQYRVGSGDKGISWVDHLIRATWQSGNPQLKRAPGSQRGR
jgi:hypothetical protein